MDKNQDEASNGPLIVIALFAVAHRIGIDSEKILVALTEFFVGLGKLLLLIMGGVIAYFFLKGVFLGLLKVKQAIDSLKDWKDRMDQLVDRLHVQNNSLKRDIRNLTCESEQVESEIENINSEIDRIKKYLGLDQEDQVLEAAAEVLNGDS